MSAAVEVIPGIVPIATIEESVALWYVRMPKEAVGDVEEGFLSPAMEIVRVCGSIADDEELRPDRIMLF